MATIKRVRVLWGGLPGMPGYSLLYGLSSADPTGALSTFFGAIKAAFPPGLQWSIPPSGDTLDDATGALTGSWSGTGASVVTSTGTGIYAAGAGAWVTWGTAGIVNGRRLKARTFLCPLKGTAFDLNGTIDNTILTTLQTAASTLASAGVLVAWHRPSPTAPSGGSSSLITTATVPDQATSLRSRRY